MWSITRVRKAAGPLFLAAVTSLSWSAQHPRATSSKIRDLAYVGDATLEMIVREWLVESHLPCASIQNGNGEKVSTKVLFLSAASLFQAAHRIGLPKVMRLSGAEMLKVMSGGGSSFDKDTLRLLSEPMEALVEAIRQHSGYDEARAFVRDNVVAPVMEMLESVEFQFHEPRLADKDENNLDSSKHTGGLTIMRIHELKKKIKKTHPSLYREINKIESDKAGYGEERIPMIAELLKQGGVKLP